MAVAGRINVFLSYAHEDEHFREQIADGLAGLRDDGTISSWHDRLITPSTSWADSIERELEKSHIVLLLLSPDFMASEYCMGVEVKRAIELHWQGRTRVVPVLVRPTPNWAQREFGTFQALPRFGKPISEWPRPSEAYEDIAEGLRAVCREIVDWENPYRRATVGDWTESEQVNVFQGREMIITSRVEVVDKNDEFVTVAVSGSGGGQDLDQELTIELQEPLEDKVGSYLDDLQERMPANAQVYRSEQGRGEEKVFIGGTAYYAHWTGHKIVAKSRNEGMIQTGRTWRCIDVPLDGVVKSENITTDLAGNEVFRSTLVLTGHGRGTGKRSRRKKVRPAPPDPEPYSAPVQTFGYANPMAGAELAGRANVSMFLGILSLFFPIVAPFAMVMGFGANRALKRNGLPPSGAARVGAGLGLVMTVGMVGAAVVLMGAAMSL